jgi:hypothetical protein
MSSKTLHDISVEFVRESLKALCYTDGTKEFWVPKSLMDTNGFIEITEEKDGTFTLTAPEWWLKERGLI